MTRTMALLIILAMPLSAIGGGTDMSPSIQDVKQRHEAQFLKMPDVVSVGIGLDDQGQPAIIVGMQQANPKTQAKIPAAIEGHPVVVRIVGPISAQ